MKLDEAGGAGGTESINGHDYTLRRLTFRDHALIKAFIKERVPDPFQRLAKGLLALEELRKIAPEVYDKCRREMVDAAMEESSSPEPFLTAEVQNQIMSNFDGISYMFWLSARKEDRNLKLEQVRADLEDADLATLKRKLDRMSGKLVPEDPSTPRPTEAATSTGGNR
jgi:hypothetical protein